MTTLYIFYLFNYVKLGFYFILVFAVLGISFVLPIFDRISKKFHIWMFPIFAVVLFLLSLIFYNCGVEYSDFETHYKTLFIDGLLGLAITGVLLTCWDLLEEKTVFNYISG